MLQRSNQEGEQFRCITNQEQQQQQQQQQQQHQHQHQRRRRRTVRRYFSNQSRRPTKATSTSIRKRIDWIGILFLFLTSCTTTSTTYMMMKVHAFYVASYGRPNILCIPRNHHTAGFFSPYTTTDLQMMKKLYQRRRHYHHRNHHIHQSIISLHSVNHDKTDAPSSSRLINNNENNNNNISNRNNYANKYQQLMDASTVSLAPMMEYTDRHFRHLIRLISSKTLLYTEMVAANSLSYDREDCIKEYLTDHPHATSQQIREGYSDVFLRRYVSQGQVRPLEGPSVLQLGGSDIRHMYNAADVVMDMTSRGWCDYTAINLNCGCPSPKVAGKGCFGAALMDEPQLVADLTTSLYEGSRGTLPITVKCRIGTDSIMDDTFTVTKYSMIDPEVEYKRLCHFIETVASNGIVTDFSIHARIAVLKKSFSPSDNRKIPPLKYDIIHRLVHDYPELTFTLNGGIESISQVQEQLNLCPNLNGVMIGRAFAADPWSFAMTDQLLYKNDDDDETMTTASTTKDDEKTDSVVTTSSTSTSKLKNRWEILQAYGKHADHEEEIGDPTKIRRFIVKAITPLFAGEPNAKRYRIALDELAKIPKKLQSEGKSLDGQPPISELILSTAQQHLSEEVLFRSPEESYERIVSSSEHLQQQQHRPGQGQHFLLSSGTESRSDAVSEWQLERKQQQQQYEEQHEGQETNEEKNVQAL